MLEPEYRYRITDYDRSLVPSRFVGFLDDGVTDRDQWIARSGRSLGHPGWGWAYHTLLMTMDPERHNNVVETGTNVGSTAIVLAQAIIDSGRNGHLHTIEIDSDIQSEAQRRFDLAGVSSVVTSHLGDSRQVLATLLESMDDVAVAFLDGNHFHDHVVSEFEIVEPKMRADGLVVFDNTKLIAEGEEDPRVHGALRTIIDRFGGNLINLPFCSWYTPGVAVWQRSPFNDMTPPPADSFVSES